MSGRASRLGVPSAPVLSAPAREAAPPATAPEEEAGEVAGLKDRRGAEGDERRVGDGAVTREAARGGGDGDEGRRGEQRRDLESQAQEEAQGDRGRECPDHGAIQVPALRASRRAVVPVSGPSRVAALGR